MMSITVKFNDAIQKVLSVSNKYKYHWWLTSEEGSLCPRCCRHWWIVQWRGYWTTPWYRDVVIHNIFLSFMKKNINRLFILVCFFWLNVKELESLTFLRKNRFFLSKLYLWDCFGFRHRLWLGHTCNFHCPLVRICPQTPILCAKVNEFRFYLCTSILCF